MLEQRLLQQFSKLFQAYFNNVVCCGLNVVFNVVNAIDDGNMNMLYKNEP